MLSQNGELPGSMELPNIMRDPSLFGVSTTNNFSRPQLASNLHLLVDLLLQEISICLHTTSTTLVGVAWWPLYRWTCVDGWYPGATLGSGLLVLSGWIHDS